MDLASLITIDLILEWAFYVSGSYFIRLLGYWRKSYERE
jgi:hypothetical protein